jgi:hypothetical protein
MAQRGELTAGAISRLAKRDGPSGSTQKDRLNNQKYQSSSDEMNI